MKTRRRWSSVCAGLSLVLAASCISPPARSPAVPAEVLDTTFVYGMVRHLYRWYMDEVDIANRPRQADFILWVRGLNPALDAGDRSQFAEIVLPSLNIVVVVKRADYTIEETGESVRNETFKIARVSRATQPRHAPDDYHILRLDYTQMREDLFRTRSQAVFPEGELLERMRAAVREELTRDARETGAALPAGDQVVHLAPLSPVANEAWVFWETGRLLIHFASDVDLANPAVWEHAELAIDLYDVDDQVVVSLDEVPGSNAYLTRDQVGRALYNCVVLGRRLILDAGTPPGPSP